MSTNQILSRLLVRKADLPVAEVCEALWREARQIRSSLELVDLEDCLAGTWREHSGTRYHRRQYRRNAWPLTSMLSGGSFLPTVVFDGIAVYENPWSDCDCHVVSLFQTRLVVPEHGPLVAPLERQTVQEQVFPDLICTLPCPFRPSDLRWQALCQEACEQPLDDVLYQILADYLEEHENCPELVVKLRRVSDSLREHHQLARDFDNLGSSSAFLTLKSPFRLLVAHGGQFS